MEESNSPSEIASARQRIREACMNLISATIQRAVGLYEEEQGRPGEIYITRESWGRFEPFCERVRSDPQRATACDEDHRLRAKEAHLPNASWCRTCHAGVHNFRLPAASDNKLVTLIGGEYQVYDNSELMAESAEKFESFAEKFVLSAEEKQELAGLRSAITKINEDVLKGKTDEFRTIVQSYLALTKNVDQMASILLRQQRKIAHEFGTLADPIGRHVDYLIELFGNSKQPDRDKLIQSTLLDLSDEVTGLFDCVATNLPEYYELKFAPRKENIERLIRNCANVFRGKANERGIEIIVAFEHSLGASRNVEVSAKHFQSALRNLIDNAVKYSFGSGEGRQREVLVIGRARNDYFEIVIENYGVGIEPDELLMVFSPGFEGRRKLREQVTGAGLGLSMVKRYIEMHQGSITVSSECKGDPQDPSASLPFLTRFTVRLPYTQQVSIQ